MSIERGSSEFEFEQLARILRKRILDGTYAPGAKITTIRGLMDEFGVASLTARRAVHALADMELLVIVPGRGAYVTRLEARQE
jgi:GntR family transcriptional regulator